MLEVGGGSLPQTATLRNWKPGDRVRLRYSSGLRKVKEVLERKHVTGTERAFGRCWRRVGAWFG